MIAWIVGIGAVGILLYEGWKRLTGSGGGGPSTPPPGAPGGPPLPDPNVRLDFEHPPRFLASPMRLLQGGRYRFRYINNLFEPPDFFVNVHLYVNEQALPAGWPDETKNVQSPSTKFGVGTWGKPTADVDRPDGLLQVWPTASTTD